jgi:hypothetical protein
MEEALLHAVGYGIGLLGLWFIYSLARAAARLTKGTLIWPCFGALGLAGFLGMAAAFNLGTHTEDSDPLYGGGDRVVDYEPTAKQRTERGWFVFLVTAAAAGAGLYKGHRQRRWER